MGVRSTDGRTLADILCCTASIWNLSIVGLDRYWAITSPGELHEPGFIDINDGLYSGVHVEAQQEDRWRHDPLGVGLFGTHQSRASSRLEASKKRLCNHQTYLPWAQVAEHGNMVQINGTWQCTFLDLPSYTVYSATGSFFIPTLVMFFVYFKIYQAFAKHRARQIYRQKVGGS